MLAIGRLQKVIFVPKDDSGTGNNRRQSEIVEHEAGKLNTAQSDSGTAFSASNLCSGSDRRVLVLDTLRGIAALQVVFTHSGKLFSVPEHYIKLTNSLTRYSVPLFLILSGALLAHQLHKGRFPVASSFAGWLRFWSSKFKRILLPYGLCCVFIAVYYQASAFDSFHWFLYGDAAVPYYFIPILFQCYLLFFLFPKFFISKYCLPAGFVISFSCLIAGLRFSGFLSPFFGTFFVYFCYGICHYSRITSGEPFRGERLKSIILLLFLILSFLVILPHEFYNLNYFYSIALFEIVLLIADGLHGTRIAGVLNYIGKISLWVFLLHFGAIRYAFDTFELQQFPYLPGLLLFSVPMVLVSVGLAIICEKLFQCVLPARQESRAIVKTP